MGGGGKIIALYFFWAEREMKQGVCVCETWGQAGDTRLRPVYAHSSSKHSGMNLCRFRGRIFVCHFGEMGTHPSTHNILLMRKHTRTSQSQLSWRASLGYLANHGISVVSCDVVFANLPFLASREGR